MNTSTRLETFEQYNELFGTLVSQKAGFLDRFNVLMLQADPRLPKLEIELSKIKLLEEELGPRSEIVQLQELAMTLFSPVAKSV